MTKDEALKLALSTLNEVRRETFRLLRNGQKLYAEEKVWNTITAIKEALAQPEQEPRLWGCEFLLGNRLDTFYTQDAAKRYVDGSLKNGAHVRLVGLYTTPPQRKPLSDDEIALIVAECASSAHKHDDFSFARAIEAAHGIKENT